MARTKGMLNLSGNLEVNAGAPLDARSVVPTVADLTNASNFQYKYVGMPVVVQATGDMYILTANDVTVAANWKQVGSGGGGSTYTAGDGIDITNDVISVDEMASADMAEIVTPLPSVMSRYPIYSEDEQMVAYWEETVNSVKSRKPLYEKIIRADEFHPTTSYYTIGQVPNDIEDIKNIHCRFKEVATDDAAYAVYQGINSEAEKWEIYWKIDMKDSGNIKVSVDTAWGTTHRLLLIMYIYYTKTTDQWIPV